MNTFTFENLKTFNASAIEASLETQDCLYLIGLNRAEELKADVCRYVLLALSDDDHSYFMWYSAKINNCIAELYELGYDGAIIKFFEYGYWT
jgi:hypothetical protein